MRGNEFPAGMAETEARDMTDDHKRRSKLMRLGIA